MPIDLLTPYLEGGIRHANFFNGRLLTAEALQTEQQANRDHRQLLGQALGAGVVHGLYVNAATVEGQPAVHVTPGLAVNREGQPLSLDKAVDVLLVPEEEEAAAGEGLFTICRPATDELYTGAGVYLLLLTPASDYSVELAPMQGFGSGERASHCSYRDTREGVQFRLLYVDVDNPALVGPAMAEELPAMLGAETEAAQSRLRNLLAQLFLGNRAHQVFARDPFRQEDGHSALLDYGLLDRLRGTSTGGGLLDCDVPLALLFWTTDGIAFVDLHAVRRPSMAGPLSEQWPLLSGPRRLIEGAATFLQFQEQVAALTRTGIPQSTLDTIQAQYYFHYLPPVGLLPLTGIGLARGFDYQTFFRDLPAREPVTIEGAKLFPLIQHSFAYPPVLVESGAEERTMFWLYHVRENEQAVSANGTTTPQSYLVFSSGYLPFQGDARFDLNHYNYSHYGLIDRTSGRFLGE
jgi:hypothetical protein